MTDPARIFTPASLARQWDCSERHVRNLVAAGELRAFKLGNKLLRIRGEDVEDFVCRQITASAGSTVASASPITKTESDTVTRLEPLTRAKLNGLHRRSTRN